MSTALIDAIHSNVREAENVSYSLNRKADALYLVGMDKLAEDLEMIGHSIVASARAVSNAFSGDLDDRLRDSQALTGSLFLATMKGCFRAPTVDEESDR